MVGPTGWTNWLDLKGNSQSNILVRITALTARGCQEPNLRKHRFHHLAFALWLSAGLSTHFLSFFRPLTRSESCAPRPNFHQLPISPGWPPSEFQLLSKTLNPSSHLVSVLQPSFCLATSISK